MSAPALEALQKRGLSSAGRAPALQAGGHRFDPDRLHHFRELVGQTSVSKMTIRLEPIVINACALRARAVRSR